MPELEEEFDHNPTVMTVGDLKAAIQHVPDDLPLRFVTADEPGSELAGPEQIAYAAARAESWDVATETTFAAFVVDLEFRPGRYRRTVWRDEDDQ
jgi:hypothetical protein